MWHINTDLPSDRSASFAQEDTWWDQVDLVKLILAANQIKEIPDDIRLLNALTILDVSCTISDSTTNYWSIKMFVDIKH